MPELPLGFVKQFLSWILSLDEQSADSTDVSFLELVLHYPQGSGQAFPTTTPDGKFQVAHATIFARPTIAFQLRIAARVLQTFGRHFALVGFLTNGIGSLVGFWVHPPQRGVRIGCGIDTLRAMRSRAASFTAARPIRVAVDLARPAHCTALLCMGDCESESTYSLRFLAQRKFLDSPVVRESAALAVPQSRCVLLFSHGNESPSRQKKSILRLYNDLYVLAYIR